VHYVSQCVQGDEGNLKHTSHLHKALAALSVISVQRPHVMARVVSRIFPPSRVRVVPVCAYLAVAGAPGAALAQAGSPFDTGAQSLLTFALAIAALIIIGVCIAAATSLISWGFVIRTIAGIAGIFGAVQIVTWIRGMFGV
jgi:type IV secretory pathway VirB2 component (pilin)